MTKRLNTSKPHPPAVLREHGYATSDECAAALRKLADDIEGSPYWRKLIMQVSYAVSTETPLSPDTRVRMSSSSLSYPKKPDTPTPS